MEIKKINKIGACKARFENNEVLTYTQKTVETCGGQRERDLDSREKQPRGDKKTGIHNQAWKEEGNRHMLL